MDNIDYQTEKVQVARSFNLAVDYYEEVATLQQTIAGRLLDRLELININPEKILDLGSGTGSPARLLAKRYRKAKIFQGDIAFDMLCYSRKQSSRFFSRQHYACVDAERLPFADSSIDLAYSNMMLQWCNDIDRVFDEVNKVLGKNGLFIFSTLGPDTLAELRESWAAVDDIVHVNAFIDMHDIGDALTRVGYEQPVMETDIFTLTYADVHALMKELKQLGAHNVNRGRRRTLTGKKRFKQMTATYEEKRSQGKLPATYEVIYGHAWRANTVATGLIDPHVVTIPVSALKRHKE